MSAAYERVRQGLEGTALAGDLDRMNAEMHLTPDAPEWVIAALTAIGTATLSRDLQATERALGQLPDTLDVSMRSAGAEIVKGLAQDIAGSTTAAITDGALSKFVETAGKLEDAVFEVVAELRKATQETTTAAQSAVEGVNERAMTTGSVLTQTAERLADWTPSRVTSVFIGVILAAGIFAIGYFGRLGGDVLGCSTRVEHLAIASHYDARSQNLLRHAACGY
jgi:hypothetical protein